MGNHKQIQTLKHLHTTLVFLFLFITLSVSSPSSSSTIEVQPQENLSNNIPAHHQVFYLKNTNPIFLNQQERFKKRKMNRKKTLKQRNNNKKKMVNSNLKSRSFSIMLPKGFVPPSGSSPCHNEQPTSVSFHCHLSASATEP